MRKILAIDTSGSICSLAIQSGPLLSCRRSEAQRQSAQLILPMIAELLEESGLELKDLDAIAVMAGPGSFTGLRIGIAVAQGLSMARDIAVIPVSNLAALAAAVLREEAGNSEVNSVIVGETARQGEIYFAAYGESKQQGVQLYGREQVAIPEKLILAAELVSDRQWAATGSAWSEPGQLTGLGLSIEPKFVSPQLTVEDLLTLASYKLELGQTVAAAELSPNYVKEELDYS